MTELSGEWRVLDLGGHHDNVTNIMREIGQILLVGQGGEQLQIAEWPPRYEVEVTADDPSLPIYVKAEGPVDTLHVQANIARRTYQARADYRLHTASEVAKGGQLLAATYHSKFGWWAKRQAPFALLSSLHQAKMAMLEGHIR